MHPGRKISSNQILYPNELRNWQHPTLSEVVEALEIFAVEPGDGKLAASIILATHELTGFLGKRSAQVYTFKKARDQAITWLMTEIASQDYDSDPSRSTNQIDKTLNCALLLLCAQITATNLPQQTKAKAYAYIKYMADQGWPRDELLPFVVARLQETRELIAQARQYLQTQVERWRSQASIQGISMALILYHDELAEKKRDELVATLKGQLSGKPGNVADKAWGLLALSKIQHSYGPDLDRLAESLLDDLSQESLINNEITPTIRLINQFPFATPREINDRVQILKQKNYAAAQRIKSVSEEGLLIDVFTTSEETWSLALHATQIAFATYALIASGYHEIVGVPSNYRKQLEEAIKQRVDLLNQNSSVIPINYVKAYNVFAVIVILQLGSLVGGIVGYVSGHTLETGIWSGVALAAIFCIFSLLTQKFVIVSFWDWVRKQIEKLLSL